MAGTRRCLARTHVRAFYFMLFSMPGTIVYHRFESFRQITVELHKKNSVERDKAFLFLEISFELSSQLEDHQDAYTR